MPELVLPTVRLHAAFLACHHEWGPGLHEDGFGIGPDDVVVTAQGFKAWVDDLLQSSHPAGTPCPPEPHASCRWIVEDGEVLGAIALRHHGDGRGGHLGYGVRPSARGRGLAGWAVRRMLVEARDVVGLDHVLAVCLADNLASARTLEREGGVLDEVRTTAAGVAVRRYRLPVPGRPQVG